MIGRIVGVLLLVAPVSSAAVVESIPRFDAAPLTSFPGALAFSALSAPALLSVSPAAALPAPAAPAAALSAAAAPAAPAVLSAAAAPAPALAAAPPSAGGRNSGETSASAAARTFDGSGEWSRGAFEGENGLSVAYKRRAGPAGAVPRVYSGGLALNESFDALFARDSSPARAEYFVWTRGHRPTGWTPTAPTLDADARDLARMIVRAARETGSTKVELALHSYGTLVFQRMSQLRAEPEVEAALKRLSGSRVVLLNAASHYAGSANRAGPMYEALGQAARQAVDMLDVMDLTAESWARAAAWNPFLAPSIPFWLASYRAQREQLLALNSARATKRMRADLEVPWDASFDSVRLRFLAALEKDSKDAGWQEALMRRSSDLFRIEFTKIDAARLRRLKIRLEFVHSAHDQLLNWESARTVFELFGIPAPERMPPSGTSLADASGLFRARIVDADHYYPLKRRDDLAVLLDP
ncbi:MAG: hypothetical protein ACHQ2Z_14485 [Elusimicrobiota bacterium]